MWHPSASRKFQRQTYQAHSRAEEVYKMRLEELSLKIQLLENALYESDRVRKQVESKLEQEMAHRTSHNAGRLFFFPFQKLESDAEQCCVSYRAWGCGG